MPFLSLKHVTTLVLSVALISTTWIAAQRRNPLRNPTGFDDVVFAISLSPDGHTLAIARGASEPSQRFGRIELWDTETGKLRHVIKGFDGPVKSVSFSPDGQTIVSGSLEYRFSKLQEKARSREGSVFGELKWWDGSTGELKRKVTLPGEGNSNLSVVLSPDGKDLVLGESFIVWSFTSLGSFPTPSITNPGFPTIFQTSHPSVYFHTDMKVFNAETGELKFKLGDEPWSSINYSPDGSLIAISNGSGVKLLNTQTGKEERKLKGFKGRPNSMAFSSDGRLLAVASTSYDRESAGNFIKIIGSSQVRVFEVKTWREIRKVTEVGAVNSVSFSPNGKLLLMGGVMSQGEKEVPGVNILQLETNQLANVPTGEDFTEAVDALAVSKDGALLAFRSGPLGVKILDGRNWLVKHSWDANSVGDVVERPASRFLVSVKRILAVAFSVDGTMVSAETDQGEIKLWDTRTGEVKGQLDKGQQDPSQAAAAADGGSFAELGEGGQLLYWSMGTTGKQAVSVPGASSASALALSADGKSMAVSNGAEVLLLSPGGAVSKRLTNQHGAVNKLAFSANGRALAAATADGTIDIWNLSNGRVESTLAGLQEITAIQLSADGQTLATADVGRDITLWNLQTRQAEKKLDKHDAAVNALAFSSDGEMLASGSDDRSVVIWDVASGKSRRQFKGHDQTVSAVAFSPDGKLLASGTGNATVVLWEVKSGKFSRILR
ncbi:MAG TPA: WD40 repeat domain-containing protein [Pyrinomonadaceae bacterium]|nr:WD40 repeat domain-containing protein [Pyrinomonadaceae bacterium]